MCVIQKMTSVMYRPNWNTFKNERGVDNNYSRTVGLNRDSSKETVICLF